LEKPSFAGPFSRWTPTAQLRSAEGMKAAATRTAARGVCPVFFEQRSMRRSFSGVSPPFLRGASGPRCREPRVSAAEEVRRRKAGRLDLVHAALDGGDDPGRVGLGVGFMQP
jgi:hypothetical protein